MFFIIWRGYGFIIPVIPFVWFVIVCAAIDGMAPSLKLALWPTALIFFLSAVSLWALGRRLCSTPPRTLIDKETGKEMILKKRHDLFFIPMNYWSYLFFGLTVATLVSSIFK